eukprot:15197843-Alexandrium_andersonii.AAC.1
MLVAPASSCELEDPSSLDVVPGPEVVRALLDCPRAGRAECRWSGVPGVEFPPAGLAEAWPW